MVPITEAAKRLLVAHSTALRWRHHFLALPKRIEVKALVGIAETDETYFLQYFKGHREGKGIILCSDSSSALAAAAKALGVAHGLINLAAGIRVVAAFYRVQNVNA